MLKSYRPRVVPRDVWTTFPALCISALNVEKCLIISTINMHDENEAPAELSIPVCNA